MLENKETVVAQPTSKQEKPISQEAYIKGLEKFHRQTKLEAEIAEFQFRRHMAVSQLNKIREQFNKAVETAKLTETSKGSDEDIDVAPPQVIDTLVTEAEGKE